MPAGDEGREMRTVKLWREGSLRESLCETISPFFVPLSASITSDKHVNRKMDNRPVRIASRYQRCSEVVLSVVIGSEPREV